MFHWRRGIRLGGAVVAIVAVSLLPLRALCGPALAHAAQTTSLHAADHGDRGSGLCCANIGDRVLIADSAVPAPLKVSGEMPFVVLLASALIVPGLLVQRPRPTGAPPPSRSYYARSARILR